MVTQRYSVTPQPIGTLLAWVRSGEIAIPEIRRPFVWDAAKVRDLLDSIYRGFSVGYLIAWSNPTIRLKDGTPSAGKRILIDGQQRVTALLAALLGQRVPTKDDETVRVRIAFHPVEERFEVANPAIGKDAAWLPDPADLLGLVRGIRVLASGREPLRLSAERVWRVDPLPVPDPGCAARASAVAAEPAVELFVRRLGGP